MPLLRAAGMVCVLATATAAGHAADDTAPREATVEVILAAGSPSTITTLKETLCRSLRRLVSRTTFRETHAMNPRQILQRETEGAAVISIWIDLGDVSAASLYLTDGANVFTRRFALARGFDAVAIDLLDVVVSGSVETVLSGRPLGVTRDEFTRSLDTTPPAAATSAPPPPSPALPPPTVETPAPRANPMSIEPPGAALIGQPPLAFSLAATYLAALAGPDTPTHGPELRVDVRRRVLWCGVAVQARVPYEVSTSRQNLHFAGGGVRLAGGGLLSIHPGWAFLAEIGAGLDAARVRTTSTRVNVTAAPPFWAPTFLVQTAVTIERWLPSSKVKLLARVGLDIDLGANRFVLMPDAQPQWSPWRTRPFVALGVGFLL